MTRKRRAGKAFEDLRVKDFRRHPVWQFTNDHEEIDTWMEPVDPLPAETLDGCIAATEVVLANGSKVFATFSNVSATNARATHHLVIVDFHGAAGRVFQLAPFHEDRRRQQGPEALADFLGLTVEDVFPIRFDLTQLCEGKAEALSGTLQREPMEPLTSRQRMQLSMAR